MKQTAMQQLLAQLKHERANIQMDIEWDRCYQAIEAVIVDIYVPMEKEQIIDGYAFGHNDGCRYMNNVKQEFEHAEQYYKETYKQD